MNKQRLAFLTLLIGCLMAGCAAVGRPAPRSAAPRDTTVEVNGVQLHFRIYAGGPTSILLEAGSGLDADTWNDIAPRIAAETGATVISYDRAGMGSSSMPTGSYDVYEEIMRLHGALHRLGRADGLVLVGHSYGGFLIHIFANLYPQAVTGMVYLDANTALGIDGIGGADAVAGPRIRANDVPDPTQEQRAGLRLSHGFAATLETVRRYPPLCGVPVVVVSAGKYAPGVQGSFIAGWRSGHYDLAEKTHGRHLIAHDAGHMVHKDDPGIVSSAVSQVFSAAERASPSIGDLNRACAPFAW